jgi:hypothetical protein
VSILDLHDSLPDDEKRFIDEDTLYRVRENKKAIRAAMLIPEKVRRYYDAQFGLGMGNNKAGEFISFSCSSCNRWIGGGHDEGCPVSALAGELDYKAIEREVERVRARGEGDADE